MKNDGHDSILDDDWPSCAAAWCLIGLYVAACAAVGIGAAVLVVRVLERRQA